MPQSAVHEEVIRFWRLGDSQHIIPAPEADEGQPRQMAQARGFDRLARAAEVVDGVTGCLARGAQGVFAAALE